MAYFPGCFLCRPSVTQTKQRVLLKEKEIKNDNIVNQNKRTFRKCVITNKICCSPAFKNASSALECVGIVDFSLFIQDAQRKMIDKFLFQWDFSLNGALCLSFFKFNNRVPTCMHGNLKDDLLRISQPLPFHRCTKMMPFEELANGIEPAVPLIVPSRNWIENPRRVMILLPLYISLSALTYPLFHLTARDPYFVVSPLISPSNTLSFDFKSWLSIIC